jgi:hypothetical protein
VTSRVADLPSPVQGWSYSKIQNSVDRRDSPARPGPARPGPARPGPARPGPARPGLVGGGVAVGAGVGAAGEHPPREDSDDLPAGRPAAAAVKDMTRI